MVFVAAFVIAGLAANAQTDSTATSTNTPPAPAKHHAGKRYMGNVTSVDSEAKTVTFSMTSGKTHTIHVTSKTKIKKDGEPATLADATAGLKISGSYHLDDSQNWVASTLNIGETKKKATPPPAQ
jgi:hypothetical protein